MRKLCSFIAALALLLILAGCSTSNIMLDAAQAEPDAPPADKAMIVFMRTSFVASAIGVEIVEIESGELSLVGALPVRRKIAHLTDPGEKVFMAYGQAADFMIANVEAGKTYYSIVRPNWGTGGFAPTPIRTDGSTAFNTDSEDFQSWVSGTSLIVKKDNADEWFEERREKYQILYDKYWSRFQTKTSEQKRERTMTPADGL